MLLDFLLLPPSPPPHRHRHCLRPLDPYYNPHVPLLSLHSKEPVYNHVGRPPLFDDHSLILLETQTSQ